MSDLDDLIAAIFDGQPPALRAEFAAWARESRRFAAFADVYRAKIRAKLRNARDAAGLLDVRAELETAALLLREASFAVEYERYAALKQRGPDFTVTFKTHTPFNVEVRRVRGGELDAADSEAHAAKLLTILLDKVGQMPPSIINLLWLRVEGEMALDHLTQATTTLRQLAERKANDVFTRYGYEGAADFQQRYRRLSGVVLRRPDGHALWLNPLARHPTSPTLAAAIRRLNES